MNISKIEKASQKYVFLAAVIGLTLFAGAKHGSPTNDPPDSTSGDSSPTNDPPPTMMAMLPPPSLTANSQQLTAISNWTRRGAYCDWKRIDFPDTFAFPSGTNLLASVTLMSYGELRESLRGPVVANVFATSNQLPTTSYQLPTLSLEPDMSSVSYGLTSSNSFVFVWENACVNRDATNRVNAAIELFQNGDIVTRFGDWEGRALSRPPEGFVGEDQDLNWATNAFPAAAAEIAEKGYQGWLDDHIGYNEPNGRYQVKVTVAALPEHGPCYLVVGPHRMVVTQPGIYSFPLEV